LADGPLSTDLIAKGVMKWKNRAAAKKRSRDREIEKQLAPFVAGIDRIINQWQLRHPSGHSVAQLMGHGIRLGRLRRFLREYALQSGSLPSGRHEIPNYDAPTTFRFEVNFDAWEKA